MGALAAAELWNSKKDPAYAADAQRFGDILLSLQQRELTGWDVPMAGFFYQDRSRDLIWHHSHLSYSQFPELALRTLLEAFPDSGRYMDWYAALALSEGETSEWIQIDNTSDSSSSTSGTTSTGDTMVLVHVDIAGKDNIKNMDNDDAWTSLATSMIHVNDTLSSEILFDAAGKLEISFTDENMMNRLRQFAGLDPEE